MSKSQLCRSGFGSKDQNTVFCSLVHYPAVYQKINIRNSRFFFHLYFIIPTKVCRGDEFPRTHWPAAWTLLGCIFLAVFKIVDFENNLCKTVRRCKVMYIIPSYGSCGVGEIKINFPQKLRFLKLF